MISHKYKFIFIRINKCGGISVRDTLKRLVGKSLVIKGHTCIREFKRQHIKKYFKFTFVRNPWHRFVSLYFYRMKLKKIKGKRTIPFKEWANRIYNADPLYNPSPKSPMMRNQIDWLTDKDGNVLMDFIGRVENFQKDFDYVCDKIGIPCEKLPHLNQTNHKHYTEYYDEATKQIVAERYARDIEYFGYKFKK